MIDLLYVSHNRLRYTQESFEALLANTDWAQVRRVAVCDDGSTDGTAEYLDGALRRLPPGVDYDLSLKPRGGPVAAMNWYLEGHSASPYAICPACGGRGSGPFGGDSCGACSGEGEVKVEMFAKVDNDMVVCPGWLPEMLRQMRLNAGLDVLGMEPFDHGVTAPPDGDRTISGLVEHVGGKGLIRHRVFSHCRPVPGGPHGYQGWTQHQTKHPDITKAWIVPDLPVFGLDQLPFEPWLSLAAEYAERGWHRPWPPYSSDATGYWDWWRPVAG